MAEKERYALRVKRGAESVGEYDFNATPAGVLQLIERIKPEFQYDILSRDGITHSTKEAMSKA